MKNLLLLTTALAALTATSALAGPVGVSGEMSYSVKNSSMAMEIGPDFTFGNIGIESRLYVESTASTFNFTGASVEANYGLSNNVDLFGVVTGDAAWAYKDAKIGVRFSF